MAVTYVQLVNELLRRLNDTVLDTTGTGFATVRGIQSLAKDAINNSIREILQHNQEWPFSLVKQTDTLVVGTGTYAFPTDTLVVDWDSFYFPRFTSGDREVTARKLKVIPYTSYLSQYRHSDELGANTRSNPTIVDQTNDESYGLTPIPDQTYSIEFLYYKSPNDLSAFDDTTIIPDKFKYIIIDGAMMYMMRHRGNETGAQMHEVKFRKGMSDMRRILQDDRLFISSTHSHRHAFNLEPLSSSTVSGVGAADRDLRG